VVVKATRMLISIDLVLIDQQSVGKRSLHLMDVNGKKRYGDHLLACQQFLKESLKVTRLAYERASFLKINDINVISFFVL
jgi:hypothetical protein